MAAITPRRSTRIPHTHTPKMSERKKGLFQSEEIAPRESLTTHRTLPVVDSESDSEECDLGIISTLDSSSGDENDQNVPKTPERSLWHETRSQTRKLLKESNDLKNFIKSPFTLKKYQTRYSCPDSKCSVSTPVTPHLNNHPGTPSSTHSCTSVHTTSSTSSRARKSLASLIADTESCSSSLKDLNFDTDSGTDSKENTPTKSVRRSSRRQKMTPKLQTFKGILMEQKKNITPIKYPVVCLTKMDMDMLSPTQIQKTPHNTTEVVSPPKLGHNRRSVVEIEESPEAVYDNEKFISHKRLRNDSLSENAPSSKYPRLENAPKARLSLFNSDRLKEILSAKSFYGKANPEMNTTVITKISSAIEASTTNRRMRHSHSHRRKRRPGQINLGVKHRIRKPKIQKTKVVPYNNVGRNNSAINSTIATNSSKADTSMLSQNSSQDYINDKIDPFDKEKQTIEALLSQWTEEDLPESELSFTKPAQELPCFNSTVIEETNQIFQPVTAVPVTVATLAPDSEAVIIELGGKNEVSMPEAEAVAKFAQSTPCLPEAMANDVVMEDGHVNVHGDVPKSGQFLPVEGGYILVEENTVPGQEELPDLDEIERELKMLDEQILKMAESNNINAEAVLASTETVLTNTDNVSSKPADEKAEKSDTQKLFPIFEKPNHGISTTEAKGSSEKTTKRVILKTGDDQYVIDAGQKQFGATQCSECGTIYQIGDPQDEHDHLVHHNAVDVLRFNGWKDECVIERVMGARILRVRGTDQHWKKVQQLLSRVIHPQLGYGQDLPQQMQHTYTAYLYIEKKQIVGCVIVEPKTRAYQLIPGDPDCCSVQHYPVKCGISRVWTHKNHRHRGIASRLLDSARASFLYGTALRTQDVAFSAPTAQGKALATKYTGTENFYVYLD